MKLRGDHKCQCTACGRLFESVRQFDAHRTGTYAPLNRACKPVKPLRKSLIINGVENLETVRIVNP